MTSETKTKTQLKNNWTEILYGMKNVSISPAWQTRTDCFYTQGWGSTKRGASIHKRVKIQFLSNLHSGTLSIPLAQILHLKKGGAFLHLKTAEADEEEYSLLLPAFKSNLAQAKVVAKNEISVHFMWRGPIKRTHIAHTFFENRWVAANSSWVLKSMCTYQLV